MLFCPYCRLLLPTFRGFVLCDATKKPPKFGGFILLMHLSILEINTYYASFFLHGQLFFKKPPKTCRRRQKRHKIFSFCPFRQQCRIGVGHHFAPLVLLMMDLRCCARYANALTHAAPISSITSSVRPIFPGSAIAWASPSYGLLFGIGSTLRCPA